MDSTLQAAVDFILQAADKLEAVCSVTKEGEDISIYKNGARYLRDMATQLSPTKPAWTESKVIDLHERRTKKKK